MISELKNLWRVFVARFTQVSGRSLKPTAAGRLVLVLAFAVGFAAMNTGNNLLFLGWGLILSSIVISGILSESTLQAATATPTPPDELRAGADETLPVTIENRRRLPGFGVELSFVFADPLQHEVRTGVAFELRLSPGARVVARVPFQPLRRGALALQSLRVATAAPFGFFAKERRVERSALPNYPALVVLPERVDTRALGRALWARLGENPAGHAGSGDELFSLRPFRNGDDVRRVAWRIAAKTGRLVMRENEATQSREILVDICIGAGAGADLVEDAVATGGSLVEDLLADGHSVGVRAPGVLVRPSRSPRQRFACLHALALAALDAPAGPVGVEGEGAVVGAGRDGSAVVAVVAGGARADHADVVVEALARPSRARRPPPPTTASGKAK